MKHGSSPQQVDIDARIRTAAADVRHDEPIELELPDLEEIAKLLRFSLGEGRIWFDTHALALFRPSSWSSLHREMLEVLGPRATSRALAQMGYEAGIRDAALVRKYRPEAPLAELFRIGPQLRAIRGLVAIRPVNLEIDLARGHFYSEAVFTGDFEVDTRLALDSFVSSPVCWVEVGYASGYASTLFRQPVIYRELECRALGSHTCRIVGKRVEEWYADEIEDELETLPAAMFTGHRPRRRASERTSAAAADSTPSAAPLIEGMVGVSARFATACRALERVAATEASVLLLGETGVGKELFARSLHRLSRRAGGPFVALNCAAIPDSLIEAELFGVERGAFTGATETRAGRFERAEGGTLFLDEIGTLSKPVQAKLLRALQEREIERVGDTRTRAVDVRIVAATNEELQRAVVDGRFREDLLFRLNVFPIVLPPLRERRDDIPLLLAHFLERFNRLHGRRVTGFTRAAHEALQRYDYPGNIRELENLVERTVILAEEGEPVDLRHLFGTEGLTHAALAHATHADEAHERAEGGPGDELLCTGLLDRMLEQGLGLDGFEERLLRHALERAGNNLAEAARLVGLTRPQFAYRLKKYTDEGG
ncbi:MAG TPA: sigma 54-interacting transcriptional regulator [Gammaproteobacteria bacterium]